MDDPRFRNRLMVYDETADSIVGMRTLTEDQANNGLKLPFKSMEVFHSTAAPFMPIRLDRTGYYQFREVLADYNSQRQDDGRTYLLVVQSAADIKAPAQLPSLIVKGRTLYIWSVVPAAHSDIHVVGKHWVIADENEILGGLKAEEGDTYGRVEREVLALLATPDET
jgi:hypothetical protein